MEIEGICPSIEKTELKIEDETRLLITVFLTHKYTQDQATLIQEYVQRLINRLAYQFEIRIGEPRCNGYSLPKENNGGKYEVVSDLIIMHDKIEASIHPGSERIVELKTILSKQLDTKIDRHLSLFRFAISQRDPVSKFLFLYSLLLLLYGDKQKTVDDEILKIDKTIPTEISNHTNRKETLFTRLRNEIAHIREDINQKNTAKEIKINVSKLQKFLSNQTVVSTINPVYFLRVRSVNSYQTAHIYASC